MFESIIEQAKTINYDFRHTASQDDPLAYLFDDWIDYYKVKWAIANFLKPSSILEIGVRFGYSAAAFLHGCPSAHYIGIDLDTDTYGGVKGAINWAKKITQSFAAEFSIADTQTMNRLPGDIYDLIHVDGQQDGDGSIHDLELAIKQARYVLVDGYLWTRQNFTAVSDFLFRYNELFDFYGVIPGYAGELLIKVSPSYLSQVAKQEYTVKSSLAIRQTYAKDYYIQDCGGFDAYKKYQGKRLEEPRLQAVAAIASLKKQGRVLDLGCGRGELTYYFAQKGFAVTAIDYSPNSIELAQKCFHGQENLKSKVDFHCDDVCTVALQGQYDLAVASDIIEHLSFEEVDTLYHRVATILQSDGLFILHTFPNLWYYQYEHPRKRRIAAAMGAYLPAQPRTRYEMLMHINEQSPRVLKKQLSKHFEHVLIWFGDPNNPGGSLLRKFSKQAVRAAPDLFAIASHQVIDREQVKSYLQMAPLPFIPVGEITLLLKKYPQSVKTTSEFSIELEINNNSHFVINSYYPNPIHISYHWIEEKSAKTIVYGGERSKILPPLNSKAKEVYQAKVKAPTEAGNYILRMTLVQELVRWFDQAPAKLVEDIVIGVI